MVSLDYRQVDAGHLRNEFLLSGEHFWKLQRHGEAGNLATGMKPFFSLPLARDCRRRGTVVSARLHESDCTVRIACLSRPILHTVAFSIEFQTDKVCK